MADDAKEEAEQLAAQMKELRKDEEVLLETMAKRSGELLQQEKEAVAALEAAELEA